MSSGEFMHINISWVDPHNCRHDRTKACTRSRTSFFFIFTFIAITLVCSSTSQNCDALKLLRKICCSLSRIFLLETHGELLWYALILSERSELGE